MTRRRSRRTEPPRAESPERYLDQWESLAAFYQHLAKSGTQHLGHNNSQYCDAWAGEANLPTFLRQCQTLERDDFPERAGTIDRLSDTLAGDLPAGVQARRQPVWGASGASVNVHRVLRGNLGHAWKRTVRQTRLASGGALTLLLPSAVSSGISHEQLRWSAVATLALADYARRSGRRVEIWSIGYHRGAYESGKDYVWAVPLVRAGESWDASAVCLTTYPEWLRRLGIRALEISEAHQGQATSGSGRPLRSEALLAYAQTQWAPAQGLAPESLLLGCTQFDQVRSHASAQRWVQARLATLAEAA